MILVSFVASSVLQGKELFAPGATLTPLAAAKTGVVQTGRPKHPHKVARTPSRCSQSILSFVEHCLIPYLYGYSYFEQHGTLPFGELPHRGEGIHEDLADLFGVRTDTVADFVRVAALKKGIANKRLCPCGSALRVGKCHHMRINDLRKRLGRQWFRFLYGQVRSG
jgi:hypothetical protein